ncbi:MAG: hypothetical protein EOM61_00355 [Bacteroidia bacterium]|mgnify:FL=1|jgi:sigma-E factor negative regulatory protein RseC|nr:hypothetical protein [Bacteroidia bacterium]
MNKKLPEYIDHEGVVKEVGPTYVLVEILNKSACSSCHAQGACSMGDIKAKLVEVEQEPGHEYAEGQRVSVKLRRTLGYKALWISYVIPLLILVVLLVSLSSAGLSELGTALSIIGTLALYYFVVWLMRDKLKKEFVFTVEKL